MRLLGLALFTLLVMGLIQFALWTDRDTTFRRLEPLAQADRVLHDFASDVGGAMRGSAAVIIRLLCAKKELGARWLGHRGIIVRGLTSRVRRGLRPAPLRLI